MKGKAADGEDLAKGNEHVAEEKQLHFSASSQ